MNGLDKIGILAEAAKYDASCSTSGSERDNVKGGIGNTAAAGICHAWSDDGRCVALLKVLLSNACIYDCAYCPNRRSNDIARAAFEPEELIRIAMDFYRRNYIEGLFLSSGIIRNPDYTMEQLLYIAKTLRTRERYNGYIHMKAIPGCAGDLVLEAARWVDRLSVNLELPSSCSLALLAPDKKPSAIFAPMRAIARASGFEPDARLCMGQRKPSNLLPASEIPGSGLPAVASGLPASRASSLEVSEAPRDYPSVMEARKSRKRDPRSAILPAGQTTQMIVGASPESDLEILMLSERLYLAYDVRRVYYSAYIPVNNDSRLPEVERPPLLREHRLYQADWLFRYYGFTASEILSPASPFLSEALDPKCAWALGHPERFPVDVERAPYEELLRVPGIGPVSAKKIVRARREARLDPDKLGKLGVVMKRAKYFLESGGRRPSSAGLRGASEETLRHLLADPKATRFLPGYSDRSSVASSGYPEFNFEWNA